MSYVFYLIQPEDVEAGGLRVEKVPPCLPRRKVANREKTEMFPI